MKKRILFVFILAIVLILAMTTAAIAITSTTVCTGGSDNWTLPDQGHQNNGSEFNLAGYDLYWVLSGGGSMTGATGTLTVTLSDGSSQTVNGFVENDNGTGAMKFITQGVAGETVTSAVANWTGGSCDAFLKISHTIGDQETTTTTSEEETTTTSEEETTTTSEGETTTTSEGETTTTRGQTTVTEFITDDGQPTSNAPLFVLGAFALAVLSGALYRAIRSR